MYYNYNIDPSKWSFRIPIVLKSPRMGGIRRFLLDEKRERNMRNHSELIRNQETITNDEFVTLPGYIIGDPYPWLKKP